MNSSTGNGLLTDQERTLDSRKGSGNRSGLLRNSGSKRLGKKRAGKEGGIKEGRCNLDQRSADLSRMRKR